MRGELRAGVFGLLQILGSDTGCPQHTLLMLHMQITAVIYLLEKTVFHNKVLSSCYLLFGLLQRIVINQEPAVLVSK